MANSRRLNAYEKRKEARALKRRERYRVQRDQRLFEKYLSEKNRELLLEDARKHEEELGHG